MNPNLNFCPEMGDEEKVEVVQKKKTLKVQLQHKSNSYEGIVPPLLSIPFENNTIQMFK
jgi:hypothetical protein